MRACVHVRVHTCICIRDETSMGDVWGTSPCPSSPLADRGALLSTAFLHSRVTRFLKEGRSTCQGHRRPCCQGGGGPGSRPCLGEGRQPGTWPPRENTLPGAMSIPIRSRSHAVTLACKLLTGYELASGGRVVQTSAQAAEQMQVGHE